MFYGFSMPIIMYLALFGLIIAYILDKLIVAWYHRKPPLYDDTLNRNTIYFMKWAAFMYAGVAYWVITNRQMFENHVDIKLYAEESLDFEHKILEEPVYLF